MRTFTARLKKFWKRMFRFRIVRQSATSRVMAVILVFATMNLTQGCYYFKVNTKYQPTTAMVSGLDDSGKRFIVHFNDDLFLLTNVEVSNQVIYGTMRDMDYSRYSYRVSTERPNRYKMSRRNDQSYLINQVHLYAEEFTDMGDKRISIPVTSVSKVEIYDRDTATTTGSWILSTLGIIASVYLFILIIALIFKQSCPFIYTFDGDTWHFAGEIFSGAIQPGLERHDYLRLKNLKPVEGQYQIKIANEIKEIQHVNLAELQIIDHPEDVEVLMDKYGMIQTVADPTLPVSAHTMSGEDIHSMISQKDDIAYNFRGVADSEATMDEITLTFSKPQHADEARLLVRAKNSMWLEHIFTGFHEMFGGMYNTFSRKEGKRPASEMRELMFNQGFPLAVYVEKDGEWILNDFFEVAGPMAYKDDILAIDLGGITGDSVRVKLETGFMFWELDYAAMDFTQNLNLEAVTVSATEATDETGKSVLQYICSDDGRYYVQPEIGNQALVYYPVPEFSDVSRTVILHSKGYYKIIREQKGRADLKTLKTFRDPGRMAQYSKEMYEQFLTLMDN